MADISGVTSYLDIQKLVEQKLTRDRQSISLVEAKIDEYDQAKDDWASIKASILSLKSSLSTLKSTATFFSRSSATSDSDIVTSTASSDAALTSYSLTNITLAQAAQQTGADLHLNDSSNYTGTYTYHNSTSAIGASVDPHLALSNASNNITNYDQIVSGAIKINDATINIDVDNDTLYEVLSKINSSSAGVTATFDSVTDTIRITQDTEGAETISFSDTGSTNFFSIMNINTSSATYTGVDHYLEQSIEYVQTNHTGVPTATPLQNVTDGYFNINGITFSVDISEDSTQDIINSINNSAAGVSAFYDEDLDQITLTAKETGEEIIFNNDTSGFLENVLAVAGGEDTVTFTAASVDVNGTTITPDGNTFTLNGTTFTLHTASVTGATVEVNRDTDTAKNAIKDFVEKYNDLYDLTEEKSASGQPLQGERLIVTIQRQMREFVLDPITNPGEYDFLRDIGIDYSMGKLSVDESDLDNALRDYPQSVGELFSYDTDSDGVRDDGGVANDLIVNFVTGLTLSSTGDISERVALYDNKIEYAKDDVEKLEERTARKELRYYEEYTAFANSIYQMQMTYQWMSSQLSSMTSMFSSISGSSIL